jgi:hypothetical protein
LVAIVLIAFRLFLLLPSHLPLPSSFTAQWLTPLFMPPDAPVVPPASTDDSGHDFGAESAAMTASSSPTRGATRMAKGEISELTDFFKTTTVIEDDHQEYHDHGWLTGNLVSSIPEVDVPTVEGSTIICFESQLTAGI